MRATITVILALLAVGCGLESRHELLFNSRELPVWTCPPDDAADDGGPPVDAGDDGGDDAGPGETCEGRCLDSSTVPPGWQGPMLVSDALAPEALPACPAGYDPLDVGGKAWDAPPASCEPCACEPNGNGTCNPPPIAAPVVVSTNTCAAIEGGSVGSSAGSNMLESGWTSGACASFSFAIPFATRAMFSNGVTGFGQWQVTPGTCTPTGGAPSVEPARWTEVYRACLAAVKPAGSCADGSTCEPASEHFRTCIMRDGSHACPSGFPMTRLVPTAMQDERTCTACTCGAESGGSCTWEFAPYADKACTTPIDVQPLLSGPDTPGECIDFPLQTIGSVRGTYAGSTPGTCAPKGGEPIGGINGVNLVTLCCPYD